MVHPTCNSDMRKSTKVVAMIDSILSGFAICSGVIVLNSLFNSVQDPDTSAYPIGAVIIYVMLMNLEIYFAFRLYRASHERDVERLRFWKKPVMGVVAFSLALVFLIRHTTSKMDPGTKYPLLWFYILYLISSSFRSYMFWIVRTYITEFQLP